jgi:hypothetical protein
MFTVAATADRAARVLGLTIDEALLKADIPIQRRLGVVAAPFIPAQPGPVSDSDADLTRR